MTLEHAQAARRIRLTDTRVFVDECFETKADPPCPVCQAVERGIAAALEAAGVEAQEEIERLRAEMGYHEAKDVITLLATERDALATLLESEARELREYKLAHCFTTPGDSQGGCGLCHEALDKHPPDRCVMRISLLEQRGELRARVAALEAQLAVSPRAMLQAMVDYAEVIQGRLPRAHEEDSIALRAFIREARVFLEKKP